MKDLQCGNAREKVTESLQNKYGHNDSYIYLGDCSSDHVKVIPTSDKLSIRERVYCYS